MTTPIGDGGRALLRVGQLDGGDAVAFNGTDCETRICLRDEGTPTGTDPNAVAVGYCTDRCVFASECDSENPAAPLRCRKTGLDPNPSPLECPGCANSFVRYDSVYLCGRVTDAGR